MLALIKNIEKLTNASEEHKKHSISLNTNLMNINKEIWKTCVNSFTEVICSMGEEYETSFDRFKTAERKEKM